MKCKSLQTIKSSLNNRTLKLDSVFFGTPCIHYYNMFTTIKNDINNQASYNIDTNGNAHFHRTNFRHLRYGKNL